MLVRKIIAITVASLLLGGAASAQFAISGGYHSNRGALIDIPVNGGITPCTPGTGAASVTNMTQAGGATAAHLQGSALCPWVIFGQIPFANRPQVFVAPANGVVPITPLQGRNLVPTTQNVPGVTLTVPPGVIQQPQADGFVPVPYSPVVLQLNTSFGFSGPITANQITGGTSTIMQLAPVNVLRPHTASFAGQPNRPATPAAATTTSFRTTQQINVNYRKGPNRFGGTMQGQLLGSGALILNLGSAEEPVFGVQPLADAAQGRTPAAGGTWNRSFTGYQPTGTRYANGTILSPCPGGFFSKSCSTVVGLSGMLGIIPGATSMNYGFPWTTGTVSLMKSGMTGGGGYVSETLSAMGADSSTLGGNRRIQLVSGAIDIRTSIVTGTAGLSILEGVVMTLPEPRASLMLGVSLGVIGLLFAVRRRL